MPEQRRAVSIRRPRRSAAFKIRRKLEGLKILDKELGGRGKKKRQRKRIKLRNKLVKLRRSFAPLIQERSKQNIARRGLAPSAVLSGQPRRPASAVTGTTLLRVN